MQTNLLGALANSWNEYANAIVINEFGNRRKDFSATSKTFMMLWFYEWSIKLW